jgi:hypothetical protein
MYEFVVFQTDTSVLVDNSIGHWEWVNGVLRGYMTAMGGGECDGAESAWRVVLNAVCIMLLCPGPSVVPW